MTESITTLELNAIEQKLIAAEKRIGRYRPKASFRIDTRSARALIELAKDTSKEEVIRLRGDVDRLSKAISEIRETASQVI